MGCYTTKFPNLVAITLCGIRRKVHNFLFPNGIQIVQKIMTEGVNDETLPNMSKSTLHKILREYLKFKYAKSSRNSALIDKNEVVVWRIKYLDLIKKFGSENRKI